MMARRQKPEYIPMRIEQLLEDREKAKQDYDKLWYTRVIQELDWAQQAIANTKQRNCYMERDNGLSYR
jgi:hypothetical protein